MSAIASRFKSFDPLFVMAVLGLVFASGCDDDDDEADSTSLSFNGFMSAYLDYTCGQLTTCCALDAAGTNRCRGFVGQSMEGQFDQTNYDSALGAACRDELNALNGASIPCDAFFSSDESSEPPEFLEQTASCNTLMDRIMIQPPAGTAAIGEACENDGDCAPVEGAEVECFDVCRADYRVAEGEQCNASCSSSGATTSCVGSGSFDDNESRQCWRDDGLYCGSDGTCQALVAEGEACRGLGESCVDGLRCGDGGQCVPKLAIGESCFNTRDCLDSYCDIDGGADSSTCTAYVADGEMCTDGDECRSGVCSEENGCSDDGALGQAFLCGFLQGELTGFETAEGS